MAASQEQKLDFLLKKIGYVQSKTGIAEDASGINGTKKAPTEENKPSPLVVPSTSVWADSTFIPASPPTSNTTYVGIYTAANAFQLTHDNTVIGNRTFIARSTFGDQSSSISGDWIDASFGADYAVQVYRGDPDSGGVSLSPTGSGNSDEWFFDYSSGILNFNGTNVPAGINTDNVYLIGYKYLGAKGVLPPAGQGDFTSFIVSGLSTFTGNIDANGDLDVDGRTELDITNISETLNVVGIATFVNNIDANGDLDVDGRTELDITNIAETLNVVGVSSFASDIDINASIDVDGHTELDDVNVSTALTANNLVVTGSTLLKHSDSLKFQTTGIGVSVSNGVGLTATIAGPSNLIIDPGVVGDNTGVVRIKGDLFVDGEQTQINSTTIELADFIVGIATTATSDLLTDGAGIQIGSDNTFLYEFNSGTNPSLKSSENLNVASGKVYQIDQTERLSADTLSLGTGTTIHSPDSNALTFGTNSTEKVRITSDGDVGIGSVIPAGKLDVVGHTELDSVNVSGLSTFASDLDINASVDIDGHTELDDLNVSGVSTFVGSIDANSDLDVDGHTELDSVNVSAASTFGGLVDINAGAQASTFKVEDLTNDRVIIAGSGGELEDDANLTFDGSTLSVGVDLDVDGRTELDITNISETLNVVGVSTFASNIDADGDLDVDGRTELDITNIAETLNVVGVSTFASSVDLNADLDVDGRTELDITNIAETLNVVGVSTFGNNIDANGDLDVDGRTELDITNISETLNVTGIATFASNVDLDSDLDVDGRTELDITNISETLNVTGIATFASNVDLNADLDVDGHTELDNVNVSAASTFAGLIDINAGGQANTFKVEDLTDNRVVIAGTGGELEDDANLTFDGSTLSVGVDLDVDGHTELDDVNVSGASTFTGNIDADGDLDVDGHTNLDNLSVSGVSTFAGNIIGTGDLTLTDTDTGSSAGPEFKLFRNNASPADADYIGQIKFAGESDTGVERNYAKITGKIDDASNGTEDGILEFAFIKDGSQNINARFKSTELMLLNGTDFSVAGDSTFTGNIDANGDLDVDGHTELDDVNVSGASTFTGNIDADGDLDVDGRTELDITNISETLSVTGITTLNSDVNVGGALSVTGNSYFVGMVTFAAGTDGNIVLGNTATDNVIFNADIDSNLIPDDNQTYDLGSSSQQWRDVYSQNVKVSSLTQNRIVYSGSNGQLQTSGNLEFIDGSELTIGVSLTVTGSLDVDGRTELDITNISETLNVTGIATFANNIDADGDLDVDGRTELDITNISETLNVTGIATFANNIDANGDLDVDGHTELDDVNVSGASTFTGNIDADGDLDVDGRTELDITNISETLNVTGIATFASNVDLNADLDVDGHTELDNLNVSGVSTFVGNVNLNTNLDVDGQTDLDVLNVAETATFTSNIDANGNLDVDGQTDLDVLNVAELATFTGNIDANGNLDVDGTTELDVLNVAETATFSSNIDADGDLDVDGHTELDDVNVSGVSTFVGDASFSGNVSIGGTLTCEDITNIDSVGIVTARSGLEVLAGGANVVGVVTASGADINGDLDVSGYTNFDNVSIVGVTTFTGNIDADGDLDVDGHTELDDVNVSGVVTATAFHTGAEGSAIRVTSSTISGPAEIIIDPAGVGDNTGALRIRGDLFVDGTQTVINSTSIELADFIVGIATTATTDALADGAGIQIGPDNTLLYDHTNTSLKSSENLNLDSNKTYKINGTDVLSADTLGSNVVNSSLTSLGTIATGVWQGTAIDDDYIGTIDNADKVSLSALNIDGGTDIGALLADGDLIIVDDGAGGTNRKADVVGITTYTFSKVSGDIAINSSGVATIQADSVTLATDTTGDFVQSISGTVNEVTVSVTSGENVQPQIGLATDVTVSNSLKVGTGITAHGGIITATTFDGNATTATTASNLTDGANINSGTISDDRLPDLITSNIYVTSGISTFVTVDLGNVYSTGIITATTFDGDINLDGNNITGNGSVNISGIITTTNALHVGTGGTVISANAETGTFAIGSATTSITATMNGGAIPSIGLVIALGG